MEEIRIERTTAPKQKPDEDHLVFGHEFTDHMFMMDWDKENGWHDPRIVPYGPLTLSPASNCLHYGQETFEGMKAYRSPDGSIRLFRPEENFKRLNNSNERLSMPQIDVDFALKALKTLVTLDADWVPHKPGTSLYIRPFVIATEPSLGAHTSTKYQFIIILSPVGAYYASGLNPVKIYVEDKYVRAVRGGMGFAKTGGNYAASMKAQDVAAEEGFSQVLWLDGVERKYIEEVGAMNVFFVIGDEVVTPALQGSILPGITRKSVIELLKSWGMNVSERRLSIDELEEAYRDGRFTEMFGSGTALFGWIDPLIMKDYSSILPAGVPLWAYAAFQTVFCATSATIVSGAMAERTKFSAYCIYSAAISLFIYPISGHWIWGGGWLAQMGFHDFAGSTAVHMVGGICALIGAKMLGPRIGKYDKNGKPRAILGHNLTFAALGVFILWFCWFGFNGASTVGMDSDELLVRAGLVFFNTNLAAAVACCATLIFTWIRYKKPDVSMTYNAALAGLVGITAGCDAVSPLGAAIMGLVFGIVIVLSVEFFDKVAKIDDPVGAISVHCVCGALGTILTGLFATGSSTEKGLFYGGGAHFLGVQTLGVVSVAAYVAVIITVVFLIIKHTIGLRADAADEIAGLDVSEHGLLTAYAGFAMLPDTVEYEAPAVSGDTPVAEAIPVRKMPSFDDGSVPKMTKVEIICRESKFEALKKALIDIGITGMTMSHVLGCGIQKGKPEYYRGVEIEPTLLPKVQLDVVVSKVPVSSVIETAKKVLYTGHIGDGKIFVYDVENVVKVRTGEEGYDALQDVE